ncbi:SMI1/KNR4 family protein [Metabacillus litoralis]|uniref:SMI1/KNR4 family protein n=1 Tax=Metabacillus litoralis TaxID=152268 RepID=UPI00292F69D6|nr:SMI1/KNR4 family protein [Metabacillus litoralis]
MQGGIFWVDILGVAKSNIASVVIETERYGKLGLAKDLVVIENCGEYVYCLDTSKLENNECPVIVWDRQAGIDEMIEANNFFEFLLERLINAKVVWEEGF